MDFLSCLKIANGSLQWFILYYYFFSVSPAGEEAEKALEEDTTIPSAPSVTNPLSLRRSLAFPPCGRHRLSGPKRMFY